MIDHEEILRILEDDFPELVAVYLFGSRATGEQHRTSDLDLGLLLPRFRSHGITRLQLMKTGERLAIPHSCDVDLINLRTAPVVLAKEIITNGILLVARDQYLVDEFEMHTLSLYQKLNEERRGILQAGISGERFHGS